MKRETNSEGQSLRVQEAKQASESSARVNTAESKSERLKLKPCPFCGGKAITEVFHPYGIGSDVWVRCLKCKTTSRLFMTKLGAARAWNRRAA